MREEGLEIEPLLIGSFIQFHSGNIGVNHPSLELKPIKLPDNRDLGVAERHSHFCDASESPEHNFNSIEIACTVAILRPLYDDIFKKNQSLKQGQGIGGRKSINVTEQTVRTMSR